MLELPFNFKSSSISQSIDKLLPDYLALTDNTIWHYIWTWRNSNDLILRDLCRRIVSRNLFKAVSVEGKDLLEVSEKIFRISKEQGIPYHYYFVTDEAISSSYKDSYITREAKPEQTNSEKEASEQIYLMDRRGESEELSNVSWSLCL